MKALRTLREIEGLGALDRLRKLVLGGLFGAIPALAPTLRDLEVTGPRTDASALATATALTRLEQREHGARAGAPRPLGHRCEARARVAPPRRIAKAGVEIHG